MQKLMFVFILVVSSLSTARPAYYGMLLSEYPGSRIDATFKCQACHNGRAMNMYGLAFATQFRGLSKAQIFKKLSSLDSDQDGISNEQEIMEGRNPGSPGK